MACRWAAVMVVVALSALASAFATVAPEWPTCLQQDTAIGHAGQALYANLRGFGAKTGCLLDNCMSSDKFVATKMETCSKVCFSLPGCEFWVWGAEESKQKCWFRAGDAGKEKKEGWISAHKSCHPPLPSRISSLPAALSSTTPAVSGVISIGSSIMLAATSATSTTVEVERAMHSSTSSMPAATSSTALAAASTTSTSTSSVRAATSTTVEVEGALPRSMSSLPAAMSSSTPLPPGLDSEVPSAVWQLGMNIHPADGHGFGWRAEWDEDTDVGSASDALLADYLSSAVWTTGASYVAIARHVASRCEAVKFWHLKESNKSMLEYFQRYDPGRMIVSDGMVYSFSNRSVKLPDHGSDPIFGVDGELAFNWWYSNNGARIALSGGHLSDPGANDDGTHGLGNELGGYTRSGHGSDAWTHDVANVQGYCHGGTCKIQGTDHGYYLSSGPVYGQYAIYIMASASGFAPDIFPCRGGALLGTSMRAESNDGDPSTSNDGREVTGSTSSTSPAKTSLTTPEAGRMSISTSSTWAATLSTTQTVASDWSSSIPSMPAAATSTTPAPPGSHTMAWIFAGLTLVIGSCAACAVHILVRSSYRRQGSKDSAGAQVARDTGRTEEGALEATQSAQSILPPSRADETTSGIRALGKHLHQCIPAWKWCVTLDQVYHLVREVDKRFPDTDPTVYRVVEEIIIPMTRHVECGYALMVNPHGVEVKSFITHAWGESMRAFARALGQANVIGGLWICFLANPQTWEPSELGSLLGMNPYMSPFYTALEKAANVVAVRNSNLNMYTRLWCVFELWSANEAGKPVSVVGPNPEYIAPDMTGYNATCSSERDTDMLRRAIELSGAKERVGAYVGQVIFAVAVETDVIA